MKDLEVLLAQKGDRVVIKNMIELYLHDLSEYWDYDLDEHRYNRCKPIYLMILSD